MNPPQRRSCCTELLQTEKGLALSPLLSRTFQEELCGAIGGFYLSFHTHSSPLSISTSVTLFLPLKPFSFFPPSLFHALPRLPPLREKPSAQHFLVHLNQSFRTGSGPISLCHVFDAASSSSSRLLHACEIPPITDERLVMIFFSP